MKTLQNTDVTSWDIMLHKTEDNTLNVNMVKPGEITEIYYLTACVFIT